VTATRLRLALAVWRGDLGGAETVQTMLAREWRRAGVEVTVVSITEAGPLAARLAEFRVPYRALGFGQGNRVLRAPRRFARGIAEAGPDGVVLVDSGYLAAVLRAGGYRGRIVDAEHGKLLTIAGKPRPLRWKDAVERAVGAPFRAVDVGVSDYLVAEMLRHPHASRVERIYNGIDLELFSPPPEPRPEGGPVVVGAAARLVPGKGVDDLLEAAALLRGEGVVFRIAGDGPLRSALEQLADRAGLGDTVQFLGRVPAMPEFWRSLDVAVVPSNQWIESFSMSTLEAMACGLPVVGTNAGGIPEVLADTGTTVPRGTPRELANAIRRYAADAELRRRDGAAAHERAQGFAIETAAARYLELFTAAA
jgi:glycosyltransferase involved in cell wall biosynthesis